MGQDCVICNHKKRLQIDRDLVKGHGSTKVSLKYGVQMMSVHNHKKNHLSRQMLKSGEMQEVANSKNLFGEVQQLIDRTKGILEDAESKDRPHISLGAIRELRQTYEFLIKFSVHMQQVQENDKQKNQEKQLEVIKDNLTKEELIQLTYLIDKMQGRADAYDYQYSKHRCVSCNMVVDNFDYKPTRFNFDDDADDSTTIKKKKKKKIKMKRKVTAPDLDDEEEPEPIIRTRRLDRDSLLGKGVVDGSVVLL
jgi:hypothetical protein